MKAKILKVKLSRFAALRNSLFRSLGGIFHAFYVQDTSRCISQRSLEERPKPQPFPAWFGFGAVLPEPAAPPPLLCCPLAREPRAPACVEAASLLAFTALQASLSVPKSKLHTILFAALPLRPPSPAQPFPQAHLQLQWPALCWPALCWPALCTPPQQGNPSAPRAAKPYYQGYREIFLSD